jgi:ribose 5-phosphate isomerase B
MKIAVGTDHAGFELLAQLKVFLQELGHEIVDYGPEALDPDDDYPDFIFPTARAVAIGDCQYGIILGGSGQGEAIAANRLEGVRAAVFYGSPVSSDDPLEIIRLSRQHNDANVLSLGARFIDLHRAKQAVQTWLDTPFSGEERHKRRIEKIDRQGVQE